jgi:Tfp pilus assembly PilM family ATPase
LLGLDWDQDQLHLVSATADRGGARIERAVLWQETRASSPAEAEAAGKRLRERMKEAGMAPAPVLACIGRDRVILKDVRFPQVAPTEEPALVRFQATKELSESPEEVVIDYTPRQAPGPLGERQALAVIVRREVPAILQAFCRGAGLKLAGLTPRPFGVAGALQRALGTAAAAQPVALLTVGERWGEFCVVQGTDVLFARALAVGDSLAGEVKRSLVVFGGQAAASPKALYVAGGEHGSLRQRLEQVLDVPVHTLDPLGQEERGVVAAGTGHGGFAGVVGLVHLWAARQELPVNLIRPKEPRAETNPRKRLLVAAAAAAAVVVMATLFLALSTLAHKRAEIRKLSAQRQELEEHLKLLAPDERDIKGIREWQQATVSWLDELYDLTARFPYLQNLRITHLTAGPAPKKTGKDAGKEPYVGRIMLSGLVPPEESTLVNTLVETINRDSHCRATLGRLKVPDFSVQIDLAKRPPGRYVERLVPPPAPRPIPQPPPEPDTESDTDGAEGGQP